MASNDIETLRGLIANGSAMIVVGSGVSIGASWDPQTNSPHPQASWVGLLSNGVEWLQSHELISNRKAEALVTLLTENPTTNDLISVAQSIVSGMGGESSKHFQDWLTATVGSIRMRNDDVVDALHELRKLKNLLATTNYDELLLESDLSLSPVTWKEQDVILRAIRNQEVDKIIFLHGHCRQPSTVILDWKSYNEITSDFQYREDLLAIWKIKTWIFVGSGINGLDDPDFGLLLTRYGKRSRGAGLWDYCLVLDSQKREFQGHFDRSGVNIRAIPYGDHHSKLGSFLRSLLPDSPSCNHSGSLLLQRPPVLEINPIPLPPKFYFKQAYLGSHKFIGREAQLEELRDWAQASAPTNVLLYEAIGGNGKSMLTWEWVTNYAATERPDWAGRFWYSFYEGGAVMSDFCRHALAYMTRQDPEIFNKKKTAELMVPLLAQLRLNPWLLVLDGLERVLVAYHRFDAPQLPDEDSNIPVDLMGNRNPCDAIREEDNDLLRAFASVNPSKIIITSRLSPRVLLNNSSQPIPGVKRVILPGLSRYEAEKLLRSCGISGNSASIQDYLSTNCDNHPLVIGALGGLIHNYLPNRGDFDAWLEDPIGGRLLELSSLDLTQRRNHILRAAFDDLSMNSKELLATMALVSNSIDYEILKSLNPAAPIFPHDILIPSAPTQYEDWNDDLLAEEREARWMQYERELFQSQEEYQRLKDEWVISIAYLDAIKELDITISDLERRGLLQYDSRTKQFDLHPVVRSVAVGELPDRDKQRLGQQVVDFFSSLAHNPFEEAVDIQELDAGLHIVRTLLKLQRLEQASNVYLGDLAVALLFNLEAYDETLSLLRPFFPMGWGMQPKSIGDWNASRLSCFSGVALRNVGMPKDALVAFKSSLSIYFRNGVQRKMATIMLNICKTLFDLNQLAKQDSYVELSIEIAHALDDLESVFLSKFWLMTSCATIGQNEKVNELWKELNEMGRDWSRSVYRPGDAEIEYANYLFWIGELDEGYLSMIQKIAEEGLNRIGVRKIHKLRGEWYLAEEKWDLALQSFLSATSMARERSISDAISETGLALSRSHLGMLDNHRNEIDRLRNMPNPAFRLLALLCIELDDVDSARVFAISAIEWARADGEPFVRRHELKETIALLKRLELEIPFIFDYDRDLEPIDQVKNNVIEALESFRKNNQNNRQVPEV